METVTIDMKYSNFRSAKKLLCKIPTYLDHSVLCNSENLVKIPRLNAKFNRDPNLLMKQKYGQKGHCGTSNTSVQIKIIKCLINNWQ